MHPASSTCIDRRAFLTVSARFGLASTLFPGALYTLAAQAQPSNPATRTELPKITPEMIDAAAALAGITIAADQKQMMLDGLNQQRDGYAAIRKMQLPNSVPPAYIFDPLPPGAKVNTDKEEPVYSSSIAVLPKHLDDLAFATIPELAGLVRTRKISSLNLTEMYIARLRKYDPKLHFVITITEDRALAQARESRFRYRLRKISRPAARAAVGREGSARRERLSHHLGRRRI
jgi:hypothetical protein